MSYEAIIYEKKPNGIAKITLNRPQVLNAISFQLLDELHSALNDADKDDTIGAIIVSGAGRAFCAGRDMKERLETSGAKGEQKKALELYPLSFISKPIIAAVKGYCVTGGLEMIIHFDIIIAAEDAVFADNHARYGLYPGGGMSQLLPRLIGPWNAKWISLTCTRITAREALSMGLVSQVVALDKLDETAEDVALKIVSNNWESVRHIKHLINRGMSMDLSAGLELEKATFSEHDRAGQSEDAVARLQKFLDKK